ncbi:MAG TPA: topoisomerase C-terminal repeat-containing protein, partial [Steroidobacteraceae bacterium]|nr:topoisomerase C-terminal repeat-containing protein [Steroidobacteraceae bacterium]
AKADDTDHVLPPMEVGDRVTLTALRADQHFTEPPPRYSEASLVKALEEHGIGRPSTYATIISTLQDREYVEMDAKRFVPTDIGKIVNRFLTDHFHRYVEYGFTAAMEDELDAVSRGEEEWTTPLGKFWKPFIHQVEKIEKTVSREQVAQARELGKDPATGKPVTVRMGRYGPFVQIGTKDDEEKPRFAGLRPGQKMDSVNLADAMELFKLPRTLGATADGEPIITNIGRFGPYVKYGSKYVSLKEDDPYTVTLERALEVIRLKQEADANRIISAFPAEGIQVLNGRYGPYVTDGKKNAKIPKDRDPKSLTLEECRVMIEQAPERGARFGRGRRGGRQAAGRQGAAAGNGQNAATTDAATKAKTAKGKRPRPESPAAAAIRPAAGAGAKTPGVRRHAASEQTPAARPGANAGTSKAGERGPTAATRATNTKAGDGKPRAAGRARSAAADGRPRAALAAGKSVSRKTSGKPPTPRKGAKASGQRARGVK